MKIFTLAFSSVFIVLTLLPFIRTGKWWIRIFDYPRVQIVFFLIISIVLCSVYVDVYNFPGIAFLICLAGSVIYQLTRILKYTLVYPIQAKKAVTSDPKNTVRIVETNIRMENKKVGKLLALVNDISPDILIVNEPNSWWASQLKVLDKKYPYSVKKPLENTYGMLLYSVFPLKNVEIDFLVSEEIPSIYTTVTLPSSIEIDLYCLHPKPPMPGSPTFERDTEILLVGKRVKKSNRPSIVVGDLNDVAWSYTSSLFQRYSGLLDPRQGRGMFNTYNVFMPFFRYPLDHFFYSNHFGFLNMKRLKSIGSDHFPMFLEIAYDGNRDHTHSKPAADAEDKQEVEEKIAEGKEETMKN